MPLSARTLDVRLFGDPVLRDVARPVTENDTALTQLIANMAATVVSRQAAGLAAPQVGVSRRVITFRGENRSGKPEVLVNPEIVGHSGEQATDLEGCLSLPGVLVPVARYTQITVQGQWPGRDLEVLELSGFDARVVQHEVDHLNGVLILARTDKASRRQAIRDLAEILRT